MLTESTPTYDLASTPLLRLATMPLAQFASANFSPIAAAHDAADWNANSFGGTLPERVVDPAEIQELQAICEALEARGLTWNDTTREDFPFQQLAPLLQHTAQELATGRGFVLLRGLPFAHWSKERARLAAWGLGCWLGQHVVQTADGRRLVDVSDVTGKEPSPRQYRTNQELRLHTDPASDIIGLACVQDARSGGESVITSAIAVHNAMLAQRPDLLALLYEGFHWHRFGEGRPEDGAYSRYKVPVFSRCEDRVSCRYVRTPIAAGHKEAQQPLSDAQIEALNLFDQLASAPELRLSLRMQPGDLLWLNNLSVMHARTEFEDHIDTARRRHMIRLWIDGGPQFRPLQPAVNYFNGGQCGIPVQGDATASYDVGALANDRAAGGRASLGITPTRIP